MVGIKRYIIPVAVYLCFLGIYAGYSAVENNNFLYQPVWDIGHYLSISETGYEVLPCTDASGKITGGICGNVGWYPGWPLIVKAVRPLLGGSSQLAFTGLAHLFCLLAFILIFELVLRLFEIKAATLTVLSLALSPAGFYLITGFPYAFMMALFAAYLLLLYFSKGRFRDVGLFITALLISSSYPSGLLYMVIPIIWFINAGQPDSKEVKKPSHWLKVGKYILPFILGPLILWIYFYLKFDDFFLQLHFQEKFGRTWAFPLSVMYKALVNFSLLRPENITIIWYGLIFILFYPYKIKAELWIMALLLFLFSPATGTVMSIYRHYLLIFPAYMIVGASSRPIWLRASFIAVGLIISLKILFPLYMAYRLV